MSEAPGCHIDSPLDAEDSIFHTKITITYVDNCIDNLTLTSEGFHDLQVSMSFLAEDFKAVHNSLMSMSAVLVRVRTCLQVVRHHFSW